MVKSSIFSLTESGLFTLKKLCPRKIESSSWVIDKSASVLKYYYCGWLSSSIVAWAVSAYLSSTVYNVVWVVYFLSMIVLFLDAVVAPSVAEDLFYLILITWSVIDESSYSFLPTFLSSFSYKVGSKVPFSSFPPAFENNDFLADLEIGWFYTS